MAESEIRQLASRYAVFMDARDIDALVALFVEDVQVGRKQSGHPALRANLEAQLRAIGISILFVGNHVIDFESDERATGIVYCRAQIQDAERWIEQAIRYDDLYRRTPKGWRFVRRRHLLFYGADVGDNPLHLGTADWPQHHTGRGTLPESLETWQAFWSGDEAARGDDGRGPPAGEGEESAD